MTAERYGQLVAQMIDMLEDLGPPGCKVSVIARHQTDRDKILIFSDDDEFIELNTRAFGDPEKMVHQTMNARGEHSEVRPVVLQKPS